MPNRAVEVLFTIAASIFLGTQAEATSAPADVIIVVDSSASMSAEAALIEQELNSFASVIASAGVDLRVIVIGADSLDDGGLCVPPPLGTGNCPVDHNPPDYVHLVQQVGSSSALDEILDQYPFYESFLRDGAVRSLLVVSDDDASLSAASFDAQLRVLDASFDGYRFNAFVADFEPNTPSDPCWMIGPDLGQVYLDLVSLTGGVFNNLCNQDFRPGFDEIASDIILSAPEPSSRTLAMAALVGIGWNRRRCRIGPERRTRRLPSPR